MEKIPIIFKYSISDFYNTSYVIDNGEKNIVVTKDNYKNISNIFVDDILNNIDKTIYKIKSSSKLNKFTLKVTSFFEEEKLNLKYEFIFDIYFSIKDDKIKIDGWDIITRQDGMFVKMSSSLERLNDKIANLFVNIGLDI